jgi:NAD(P)-dependent dehydrogenase (short-subunit alcohol dehydrogenase family)
MPTSVPFLDQSPSLPPYPELSDIRILISGISVGLGPQVLRTFALQGARLVTHTPRPTPALAREIENAAAESCALRCFSGEVTVDPASCRRLASAAAGAFGGIDAAVILLSPHPIAEPRTVHTEEEADALAAEILHPAHALGVALSERSARSGRPLRLIYVLDFAVTGNTGLALCQLVRAGLEALTRDQARRWASRQIAVTALTHGLAGDVMAAARHRTSPSEHGAGRETALLTALLDIAAGRRAFLNGVTLAVSS